MSLSGSSWLSGVSAVMLIMAVGLAERAPACAGLIHRMIIKNFP